MFGKKPTKSTPSKPAGGGNTKPKKPHSTTLTPSSKRKLQAIRGQLRTITNKPFVGGSSGSIPRSFLQGQQQQQLTQQNLKSLAPKYAPGQHPGYVQDPQAGLIDPTKKRKTKGQMALDNISIDQAKDAKDISALFTPENLDKYPFLGVVYDQVKQGNLAGATETLYTVTRTVQQDLDMDPALQSIYDPTKHKDFADALGQLLFNDEQVAKNTLPKPVAHATRLGEATPGEGDAEYSLTRGLGKRSLGGNLTQPNPLKELAGLNATKPGSKVKSVLSDEYIKQQALAGQKNAQMQVKKEKEYKSSGPAPKQLSPNQWKQITTVYKRDFDSFDNPTFMKSANDYSKDPVRRSALGGPQDEPQEPLLASLLEKNPWYLPDGQLNVSYIRDNARNFDESHTRFLRDDDIETVLELLQSSIRGDAQKSQFELQQEEFAKIEQRSIEQGSLRDRKTSPRQPRRDDSAERAQEAFGSQFSSNIPSTASLTSQAPKRVAKYQADRHRIDAQLGGPLLEELNLVGKLSPEEREQMGLDPLRGSLSLLTQVDIERIKKEYNFSDPADVMHYIKRYLGRTAAEVDHQYNLPREQYELIQQTYEEEKGRDDDIAELKRHHQHDLHYQLEYHGGEMTSKEMQGHYNQYVDRHTQPGHENESPAEKMRRELHGAMAAHGSTTKPLHEALSPGDLERPDGTVLRLDKDGKPKVLVRDHNGRLVDPNNNEEGEDFDENTPQGAQVLHSLLGGKIGENPDDDSYMQRWLETSPDNKNQSAVGLAGVFGEAAKRMREERDAQSAKLDEIEREENHGLTKEEVAQRDAERMKQRHRAEYEASLDDHDRARFRAVQIAMKVGKRDELEWIDAKTKQILKLFQIYRQSQDKRAIELLYLSPEARAERIMKKTQDKMDMLYKKYLPEETFEEKQARLEREINTLKQRGDKAALEHKMQQESAQVILEENLTQIQQVNYALKQRQDALIRRQREISMHQRAMEWSAEGKTPEEVVELEAKYAAEMAAKGIDISPITAELKIEPTQNEKNIKKLLAELDQIKPVVDLGKTKEFIGIGDLANDLPKVNTTSTTVPQIPPTMNNTAPISTETPSNPLGTLTGGQVASTTETKPLLGPVQRRKLLRELKNRAEGNTIPSLDANGVIQIPPEEFQRRVEAADAKKREIEQKRMEEKRNKLIVEMKAIEDNLPRMEKIEKARLAAEKEVFEAQNPSKSTPKATKKEPRFEATTAADKIQAALDKERHQEELMMRAVMMNPISLDTIDKQPPNIDHLLSNVPTGAIRNPSDLVLPSKDPKQWKIARKRNQERGAGGDLDRIDPQKAQELRKLRAEVRLLRQAQSLPIDDLVSESDSDDIDVDEEIKKLDQIDQKGAKNDKNDKKSKRSTQSQVNELSMEKAILEQNIDQISAKSPADNIVIANADSSEPEALDGGVIEKTKPTFSPEDESNLKALMGEDYIPDVAAKQLKLKQAAGYQVGPSDAFASSGDKISKKNVKNTLNPLDDGVNDLDSATPKTRSVVLPDGSLSTPVGDVNDLQVDNNNNVQNDENKHQMGKINLTSTSTTPPEPSKPLSVAEQRRAQKEAKRLQKVKEAEAQLEALITPGRVAAQEEAAKKAQQELQHNEFLAAREAAHKEAAIARTAGAKQTKAMTLDQKKKEIEDEEVGLRKGPKVGGENVTAIDTKILGKKVTQHASALDAFFADQDDFDGLFGAQADPVLELTPEEKENAEIQQQVDEELKKTQKELDFVDLETVAPSVLEDKAEDARKAFEEHEEKVKSSLLQKSNLSLLGKLSQAQQQGSLKTPFERQRDILNAAGEEGVPSTPVAPPVVKKDHKEIVEEQKKATKSLFSKLEDEKKAYTELQQKITTNALNASDPADPKQPRKSNFSLSSITMPEGGFDENGEYSQEEIEFIDDKTGLPTKVTKKRVKPSSTHANALSAAFRSGSVDKQQRQELMNWLTTFRSSLGLPEDSSLVRKDFSKTPLLPPHLAEEFEDALLDTHSNNHDKQLRDAAAAKKIGLKINPASKLPSIDDFRKSIEESKEKDPDGFIFMMSVLYENGGNVLLIMSRAFGQAQRDVAEGRVKSQKEFRLALEGYGLTREMMAQMGGDLERLYDDLEADKLGLDQGGELVEDEGTPIVQDPLADQVANSTRPIYGDGTTDLNLLAVMKRKERSKIFLDLDKEVDDQMEEEIVTGTGLFKALTQPRMPVDFTKFTTVSETSLIQRPDKYQSKLPAYMDDKNKESAGKFEDFFNPTEKVAFADQLAPEGANTSRRSVFAGLMKTVAQDTSFLTPPVKTKFELTPDLIGSTPTPYPDRITRADLDHIDAGIRNRLEVLVDRISRHTLLTPALVLEKMENPREFGKLLGSLTADMVEEMKMVDALLDDQIDPMTKKLQLEMADIKNPHQLSDNQIFGALEGLQTDLKNLWEQNNNIAPRDVVFIEDQKRDYLRGFIEPSRLGLTTNADGSVSALSLNQRLQRYLPSIEDINNGKIDPKTIDFKGIAQKVMDELRIEDSKAGDRLKLHQSIKDLERYEAAPDAKTIESLMGAEKSQGALLAHITKAMAEKDKLLTNSLFKSVRDGAADQKRLFIVDEVKDRGGPIASTRRKLQLLRLKDAQMKEIMQVHEITYNRLLANVEVMEAQLRRGQRPQPLLRSLEDTPEEQAALLEEMFGELDDFEKKDDSVKKIAPKKINSDGEEETDDAAATKQTGLTVHKPVDTHVSFYDVKFGRQQLENFDKNPTTSPLAELLTFWADPSTKQEDMDRLTGELAHTTFGRLYKIFGAFFPTLPKKMESDVSLTKFFESKGDDAHATIDSFLDGMKNEMGAHLNSGRIQTDHTFGHGTQLGRLVRSALEETAISQLPAETQDKIAHSKAELEKTFNEYRQLEIMLDRQSRLFILERERKQLGLPDFQELNMLKTKFDLLLSTLQTPGLHNDKKQQLMDSAREIMQQTIAVRNLKDNDPEMFYWRTFLAKIPPKFHKTAMNCHNMPIDPMRLFEDLNPTGELPPTEVLKNVLRFLNENYRSTQLLLEHVENRATSVNFGSPTMTLRDLRKEQLACRRLLKFKNQINDQRIGVKESIRQHHSENYIHQLRVVRMRQLMDEPDANEAKRAQLEFWLDESHQKGKGAGLKNALLQDLQEGLDSPIAAINPNSGMMIAHKKMLKRRKAHIDPILFNSKSSRLFSNDRLNPLVKYQKILQRRGERRKASLKRLAAEEALEPTELAAINAAREGNRLLSYLGTHGAGSTNLEKDMQDLLIRQANLLEEQKSLIDLQEADDDEQEDGETVDEHGFDPDNEDDIKNSLNEVKEKKDKKKSAPSQNPQRKPKKKSGELLPLEVREEKKKKIDSQLAVINKQIAGIITKKEDFDATVHVRHDAKDSSLVHIANQPYVYCRVVASYGQTVVVEQCGSNSYMKHSQFFVQDELQQIQRAAGLESVQLDNRDNLDHQSDDEFDEQGNPRDGQLTIPKHERKRNAIRGNRRRWHCIKSRHMDLLCGDYVFIDPAPGRAWSSGAHESTANSTLAAMNNTGADDHGLVKAAFSRLNTLEKSGRSTSKLQHLEESNPMCANIDHMIILCAAEGQPAFSTSLIDRYLAAAQFSGIKATIVYNKIDLIEMVSEAEKILTELKEQRLTIHEKEKTLKKKMGKRDFKKMKRNVLKDQKKKLRDTHFYTTTMQRYMNKLLYSEALAKELQEFDEEEEYERLVDEQEQTNNNTTTADIYEEDEQGRLTMKKAPAINKKKANYSVPALVKRQDDPALLDPSKRVNALDYYYNDEEYDDDEEDRVLLEQQLERWINKKKRQVSRGVEEKLREYERIGIKVIRCSARTGVGIDELEGLLSRFHSTGFVGQSGVGKSSLLNSIIPDLDLQTSNITVEGKGQHTTTSSRMFHLPNGGSVIDTPGSQSFLPPAVDPDYVQELFPEIKALAKYCKLGAKCCHSKEVGCAVREAVGDGSNRAIIPVTITELFDPLMMTNIRVKEFRARLEAGELREIAGHYAGNDPVLLYAQRFYRDLDAGKIMTQSVHSHIPMDTAVDLGAKVELDERGQSMLHAQEDARRTHRSTDIQDFEKLPSNVLPLEESDIESDGQELPYHIRKLKHQNREIVEMVDLKLKHFGDDAQFTEEEEEYEENKAQLEEEIEKHRVLKAYKASGGTPGDDNDPYVKAERQAKEKRRAERAKRREQNLEVSEGEFDYNFDYNIDAMTQEILRLQKADLVFEAEHLEEATGNAGGVKEDIYADARKTAIALAEIDLQDRLKRHQERKSKRAQYKRDKASAEEKERHEASEKEILKMRAERLGISVEKLLELQTMIKKQRQEEAEAEELKQEQEERANKRNNNADGGPRQAYAEPVGDNNDVAEAINTELEDFNEPQEAIFERIDDQTATNAAAQKYHNTPQEHYQADKPLTRKEKFAQLQYQQKVKYTPHPSTLESATNKSPPTTNHSLLTSLNVDSRMDNIDGSYEATSQIIMQQNADAKIAEEQFNEANAPAWRKQRDKLTQRRFASRLPANSNAYIPQFRYDNYLALVDAMKKTEEFLEKRRKKKSLTKQEEAKLSKQKRQAELFEKRQLQRRRVLLETDPFGVRGDLRELRDKQAMDPTKELSPAQMEWFSAKLGHSRGDAAFPGKLSLLTGNETIPIRPEKTARQLDNEHYNRLLTGPDAFDNKSEELENEVQGFQTQMLDNMSAIYNDRRAATMKDSDHADHWRRKKQLKATWSELAAADNKRKTLASLEKDDRLARQKFGGFTNRFGEDFMGNSPTRFDDEGEVEYMKRRMRYGPDQEILNEKRRDQGIESSEVEDRYRDNTYYFTQPRH